MTVDQLRTAREANPFRPFVLHAAGGRSFRVPHRDYISISPSGRTVIVYQTNDAFSILDLLLITELEVEPLPGAPAEGAA
ncbi:MAG: hypothetical protein K2X82_23665 [Gemmataceae bacterium]|nr:hypothetical protein [Gemmataceae bacterium]